MRFSLVIVAKAWPIYLWSEKSDGVAMDAVNGRMKQVVGALVAAGLIAAVSWTVQGWILTRTDGEVGVCYDISKSMVGNFDEVDCSEEGAAMLVKVGDLEEVETSLECSGFAAFVVDRLDYAYCFDAPGIAGISSRPEQANPETAQGTGPWSAVVCSNDEMIDTETARSIVLGASASLPVEDVTASEDGVTVRIDGAIDDATAERICEGSPMKLHYVLLTAPREILPESPPGYVVLDSIGNDDSAFIVSEESIDFVVESVELVTDREDSLLISLGPGTLNVFNGYAQSCYSRSSECSSGQIAIVIDGRVALAPTVNVPVFESPLRSSGPDMEKVFTLIESSSRRIGSVDGIQRVNQ